MARYQDVADSARNALYIFTYVYIQSGTPLTIFQFLFNLDKNYFINKKKPGSNVEIRKSTHDKKELLLLSKAKPPIISIYAVSASI